MRNCCVRPARGLAALLAGVFALASGACTPQVRTTAAPPEVSTTAAPSDNASSVLARGRSLEACGRFQNAYDLYGMTLAGKIEAPLRFTLQLRYDALKYLVPDPLLRRGESVYWKPKDQVELDKELANLRAGYGPYKQLALAITSLAMPATKDAQTTPDKAAYEAKVGQVMDAYVLLVAKSTPQQRTTFTLQQLNEGIRYMTGAMRNWDKPDRVNYLVSSWNYFDACRERLEMTDPFGDNFWPR
jgi:hypothetical protein